MKRKKIIVSVISDLVSDQRVHRVCSFLHEEGYEVLLVGRKHDNSLPLEPRVYATERLHISNRNGTRFYAEFSRKLLSFLLRNKADCYLSNDLDTLAPNYFVSTLRKKPLYYDTHEYFTGMPELEGKSLKKAIWRKLEKFLLPRIKKIYTVNNSVAAQYKKDYGVEMKVVRNLPVLEDAASSSENLFPAGKIILLLQGAGINKDRGAEELIRSVALLPENYLLYLIGSGEAWESLKLLAKASAPDNRVFFIEKVPFQQLKKYTRQAHIGFSLDKPISLNYQLSLPNKLFDYIHANIPVIASPVFEVKQIVENYKIGTVITEITPEAIAHATKEMMENKQQYETFKTNAIAAAKELCWQHEKNILKEIFDGA